MRIHQLEIQAFGPFAERQSVPFDALSSQGLFLLNGPTGAGKSSVLDAVCFALYGSVPGARQATKRLRSDHAAESVAPEVCLEFSVAGRRFRIVRSPAWERPARRGSGTTTEQARTLLSEWKTGEWVQMSARNDEVGLEVQALLGMDKEQFTKVVMLPQGEFAAFLRADAKTRRELLQRLFSTTRFEDLERLFTEESQALARRLAEQEDHQRNLFLRAVEEAERHDLATTNLTADPTADASSSAGWAATMAELTRALSARWEQAAAESTELTEQSALADGALAALTRRRERFRTLAHLREQRRQHGSRAEEMAHLTREKERHDQASGLAALLELEEDAESGYRRADEDYREARERALRHATVGEYLAPDALAEDVPRPALQAALVEACASSSAALAVLRAALPDEKLLLRVRADRRRLDEEAARLDADILAADRSITDLQEGRAQDTRALDDRRAAADGLTGLREDLARALSAEDVVGQYASEQQRLVAAETVWASASGHFLRLKEAWLDALQLRLEQAAQELADALRDGDPCPVCGSPAHPAPVSSHAGRRVSLEEEQGARRLQAEAEAALQSARDERDRIRLRLAELAAGGGSDEPEAAAAASRLARSRVEKADAARRECVALEQRLAGVDAEEDRARTDREALHRERVEVDQRRASLTDQESALGERIAALRAAASSLSERVDEVQQASRRLEALRQAAEAADRAEENRGESRRRLGEALLLSVFETASQARDALIPDDRLAGIGRVLGEYVIAGHRLDAAWEDAAVQETLQEEQENPHPPSEADETDARTAAADLRGRAQRAVVGAEVLGHSVAQLESYSRRFADLERSAAPLRAEVSLALSVAETARGGGENLYKMSLATYVLASRLEQVADAATERLLQMSDGRYQLVHSDATAGNRRSGLGLNVIDGWTGNRRDTSTLSGGESFMASLALALGLADVVQQEAGGLDIETLFVDEGFGSLDDQALEQVMDALDGLRSGGRVVGLVSHVPELKQRIGAQLQVVKGRQGSTLRFVEQTAAV
ncbi:SMC family ATPase [Arthrobacter agilis]|uniref:AAA family ATPase n=1 Tax=Arthrobacter agilis TaxID=37921 RepID=UPI000B34D296|nr:SMC family ATPase [Arthrobacter agilis]OUM44125.1 hypothetical protein B8W74_04425 [Arthrobacter agilis]PPB46500.1 SMC family ATPase [Arthrobacter agilis]TPV23844.1 SMC family ATPase [Arthrobacter agilis]VDR32581.1 Nuclease sbcCD subunit C [Arthrobacter agilis]